MKSLFRLSETLLVNFADIRFICKGEESSFITWLDGTTTDITDEEADLAIRRHREIYQPREDREGHTPDARR